MNGNCGNHNHERGMTSGSISEGQRVKDLLLKPLIITVVIYSLGENWKEGDRKTRGARP